MSNQLQLASILSPGQDLSSYIQTVNTLPLLTAEQEQELGLRLQNEGDLEAARILVLSHLRFVVHLARSYQGYGLPQADLIQEGNLGLMKAVKRFDPSFGVRLVSFAVHWIKAEIHEYVLRNWRIVKVATTKAQRKLFFNLRSAKKDFNWLNNDEVKAIAADLNVKPETVREMEGRLTANDAAFDGYTDDSSEDSFNFAPANYLEDSSHDPAILAEEENSEDMANSLLREALNQLDERSRDILQQRWLSSTKATLHDLAAIYKVSAERIRQIEKNAMNKIKASLANQLPA